MGVGEVRGSRVTGLGHYQPDRVLTNDDIARTVDTTDDWILTRTGIRERRIAADGEGVVDMALPAARMALADAGVDSVDLVIVATTTAERRSPNVAGRVSAALGAGTPGVLDVNTACSGFEYAIGIADQSIRLGTAERALVIGTEKFTEFTDWTDRRTCILTADGAGAMVVEAAAEPTISPTVWGSVPDMLNAVVIDDAPDYFTQDGRAIMRWALTHAPREALRVLDAAGMTIDDVDVIAFHQANMRIIDPLAQAIGASERHIVIRDIVESGNTSAASVPLGLSKAWHAGELPRGGKALLFGFGGGFTFAGQVVTLPE